MIFKKNLITPHYHTESPEYPPSSRVFMFAAAADIVTPSSKTEVLEMLVVFFRLAALGDLIAYLIVFQVKKNASRGNFYIAQALPGYGHKIKYTTGNFYTTAC